MTFYRLFYPRQTCFLCAAHENKPNVTVVDWLMPVSLKPPMLAVALNNNSQSLDLLSHSKEFTISVMPEKSKETAALIGATTGRLIDKIDEYHIALVKSRLVDAPTLKEALGSAECKVVQISNAGDHSLVVGEVVQTHYPDEEDEKKPALFNWGSKNYFGMENSGPKDAFKEIKEKDKSAEKESKEKPAEKSSPSPKEKSDEKDKSSKDKPLLQLSAPKEKEKPELKEKSDEKEKSK